MYRSVGGRPRWRRRAAWRAERPAGRRRPVTPPGSWRREFASVARVRRPLWRTHCRRSSPRWRRPVWSRSPATPACRSVEPLRLPRWTMTSLPARWRSLRHHRRQPMPWQQRVNTETRHIHRIAVNAERSLLTEVQELLARSTHNRCKVLDVLDLLFDSSQHYCRWFTPYFRKLRHTHDRGRWSVDSHALAFVNLWAMKVRSGKRSLVGGPRWCHSERNGVA